MYVYVEGWLGGRACDVKDAGCVGVSRGGCV